MKIINGRQYSAQHNDSVYNGKIVMSQQEFDRAIVHIMKNKNVPEIQNGSGKYAYLGKQLLRERVEQGRDSGVYALGVYATDYIFNYCKERGLIHTPSRFHYKHQNYLIVVPIPKSRRKFKVEFVQTETFVVDVYAKSEKEATELATEKFQKAEANGTSHYMGTGNGGLEVQTIYDVTNTDDPFNP